MTRTMLVGTLGILLGVLLGVTLQPGADSRVQHVAVSAATDTTADLAGIRALHRADSVATLSGDPDALAMLFTSAGVRMEPGGPAVVGREAMRADDTRYRAAHPGSGITKYAPHPVGLEIHGDWAVEWGYFDSEYIPKTGARPLAFRAKVLRVLHREADGKWRFSHVMWNIAE